MVRACVVHFIPCIATHWASVDLNFGTVAVHSLTLSLLANHCEDAMVMTLFRLLMETEFPRLRLLSLSLGDYWGCAREDPDEWNVWDPFERPSARTGEWALPSGLAAQLARVTIDLRDFDEIANARAFFALFGCAGEPGIMRVVPERVAVNMDPPGCPASSNTAIREDLE
jgi:hypothetical protein